MLRELQGVCGGQVGADWRDFVTDEQHEYRRLYPKSLLSRVEDGSVLIRFSYRVGGPRPVVRVFNARRQEESSGWIQTGEPVLNAAKTRLADLVRINFRRSGGYLVRIGLMKGVSFLELDLLWLHVERIRKLPGEDAAAPGPDDAAVAIMKKQATKEIRQDTSPLDLSRLQGVRSVLVVDKSGSVESIYDDILKSANQYLSTMRELKWPCSVVVFSNTAEVIELDSSDELQREHGRNMFGGTNYDAALDEALRLVRSGRALEQRVVFFTDGEPNGTCTRFPGLCDAIAECRCQIYAIGLSNFATGNSLRSRLAAVARPRDLVFMAMSPEEVDKHFEEIGRADF